MSSDLVVLVIVIGGLALIIGGVLGAIVAVWRTKQQERQRRMDQLGSVYHSRERRERKDNK